MNDWNLISIGKILAGLSIGVAGIIIAAILLGFTVPYGPFLLFTCIVLTVLSAGIIIVRLQQCKKEPEPTAKP